MRFWYAIEYAYGRHVLNNGLRGDLVYRFATKAERNSFVDRREREGVDVDPVRATDPRVKRALRYYAVLKDWPIAVFG